MSNTHGSSSKGNALRLKTIRILEELLETAQQLGLPQPLGELEPLDIFRQKLIENTYTVLVAGEVKRGKSTFVNALMGRDLLPTDPDVATSQVFYVRRASQETYRLRFEDGTEKSIPAGDLARYGSQVWADKEGAGEAQSSLQPIRWVEIEGPFGFIPQEVHILDTPGLGSLYRDHATITRRFVRYADAVIFVLDSTQLAGNADIEFLNELLAETNHIFFIQTKIDKLTVVAWQEIQHRHEALLTQQFYNRLPDTHVWPIASTLLRNSTKANDPFDVASHHRELAVALQDFLAHVSGLWRIEDALTVAESYFNRVRQTKLDEQAILQKKSSEERQELLKQKEALKQQFYAAWGKDGTERKELLAKIARCFDLAKREFDQAIRPHGHIESLLRKRIDDVGSVGEVKQMAESLTSEAVSQAMWWWEKVCDEAAKQCAELVKPFRKEVMAFATLPMLVNDEIKVQITANDTWWTRLKHVRGDMLTVTMIGSMATVLFPPAAAVAVPVAIGVAIFGWGKAGEVELTRSKQQLQQHLATIMQAVRKRFLDVNLAAGQYSHVHEYFERRKQAMDEVVGQIVRQQLTDMQESIQKLDAGNQSTEQREGELLKIRQQLTVWNKLEISLKEAIKELGTLK